MFCTMDTVWLNAPACTVQPEYPQQSPQLHPTKWDYAKLEIMDVIAPKIMRQMLGSACE